MAKESISLCPEKSAIIVLYGAHGVSERKGTPVCCTNARQVCRGLNYGRERLLPPRVFVNASLLPRTGELVLFLACFFAIALPRQRLLHALLFTWLQVKRMPLYFLDNVFRLHFTLETTESILQRLAFLNSNFCQRG